VGAVDQRAGGTQVLDVRASRRTLQGSSLLMCALLALAPLIADVRAEAANETPGPSAADLAALGKLIFFDPSLSASGRLSCASCHSPAHAYGPPDGRAVQLGGPGLSLQGARAVPSLRYTLNRTPVWSKEYVSSAADRILEGNEPPAGGFGWDGRFKTLRDQAVFPLLAPNEMANSSPSDVAAELQRAAYAGYFRKLFGARVFDDPPAAYAWALRALERFELDDPSFHPFTSKFDGFLEGTAKLSAQELRGLALFNDPRRGNCAACHLDAKGADGSHPIFTDYQFEALGVPRNPEIRANASLGYFDEGLCGPLRTDQARQAAYCGMFKTPTLRNVAIRRTFFHNGRFHSLKDALRFYVRRDTDPKLWYPVSASGSVDKFDDLPPALRANVDVVDEPLTREAGDAPAWSDAEIDDVIAFLATLTDADALAAAGPMVGPTVAGCDRLMDNPTRFCQAHHPNETVDANGLVRRRMGRSTRVLDRSMDGGPDVPVGIRLALHDHLQLGLSGPQPRWVSVGLARPHPMRAGRPVLDHGDASRLSTGRYRTTSGRNPCPRDRLSMHGLVCMAASVVSGYPEGPRPPRATVIHRIMHRDCVADFRGDRAGRRSRPPAACRVACSRAAVAHSDGDHDAGLHITCTARPPVGRPRMAHARRARLLELRLLGMDYLRRLLCVHRQPVLGHDVDLEHRFSNSSPRRAEDYA